jgi:hypothetical protein
MFDEQVALARYITQRLAHRGERLQIDDPPLAVGARRSGGSGRGFRHELDALNYSNWYIVYEASRSPARSHGFLGT